MSVAPGHGLPKTASIPLAVVLMLVSIIALFCCAMTAGHLFGDGDRATESGQYAGTIAAALLSVAVAVTLVPLAYPPEKRRWVLWVALAIFVAIVPLAYLPHAALTAKNWRSTGARPPGGARWVVYLALILVSLAVAIPLFWLIG